MAMTRTRLTLLALLVVALAGALTAGAWAVTRATGWTGGAMAVSRHGMMGGYGVAGDGQRVTSLDAARAWRRCATGRSPG
jgi:hypothetical protein